MASAAEEIAVNVSTLSAVVNNLVPTGAAAPVSNPTNISLQNAAPPVFRGNGFNPGSSSAPMPSARTRIQERLEAEIIRYQKAHTENRGSECQRAYDEIDRLYRPMRYATQWFKRYGALYDSREDFDQEYTILFLYALEHWKPRSQRSAQQSRGGSGEFQNYFMTILANRFSNAVVADAAQKRNIPRRCPICDQWCGSLSTHVLNNHHELLWDQLALYGFNVEKCHSCPLCPVWKAPKSDLDLVRVASLKKHLLKAHSSLLFERFHDLFPDHPTLSTKAASIYQPEGDGSGEESDLYEQTSGTRKLDNLLAMGLTNLQRQLVHFALENPKKPLAYKASLYNCTQEEFDVALGGLRDFMALAEMAPDEDAEAPEQTGAKNLALTA